MFVFPALDTAYKTRKRAFKCCKKCRAKRMKCSILLLEYETNGCDNCKLAGLVCDLIASDKTTSGRKRPRSTADKDVRVTKTPSWPKQDNYAYSDTLGRYTERYSERYSDFLKMLSSNHYSPGLEHLVGLEGEEKHNRKGSEGGLSQSGLSESGLSESGLSQGGLSQGGLSESGLSQGGLNQNDGSQTSQDGSIQESLSQDGRMSQISGVQSHSQVPINVVSEGSVLGTCAIQSDMNIPRTKSNKPYHIDDSKPSPAFSFSLSTPNSRGTSPPLEKITAIYLKDTYDFNVTWLRPMIRFLRLVGRSDIEDALPLTTKEEKWSHSLSEVSKAHIRNPMQYAFLKLIDAFTVDSPLIGVSIAADALHKLYRLFFYKVNLVFPIVEEDVFWREELKVPNIIKYAMVCVVLTDPAAVAVLSTQSSTPAPDYQNNLATKIRQLLLILPELGDDVGLTRLRCHLLLCLHFNFDSFGNEQNAHDLSDAVNYMVPLVVHVHMTPDSSHLVDLFWTTYVLDKFNAIANSKAVALRLVDYELVPLPALHQPLANLVEIVKVVEKMLELKFTKMTLLHRNSKPVIDIDTEDRICDPHNLRTVFSQPVHSASQYALRSVYFLTRMLVAVMGILLSNRSGRVLNDRTSIDVVGVRCLRNLLRLYEYAQIPMQIPLVACCLSNMSMVPIRYKMRIKKWDEDNKNANPYSLYTQEFRSLIDKLTDGYLERLRMFAPHWWLVQQNLVLLEKLAVQGYRHLPDVPEDGSRERKKSGRDKLRIGSLITSEARTLPPVLCISSPDFVKAIIEHFNGDDDVSPSFIADELLAMFDQEVMNMRFPLD